MKRRIYLRTLDAVGVGAALAGCNASDEETPTETPRPTEETPTPELELTVFDAVDDLGMDSAGQEPVDDILDGTYGNDTAIEFPPGNYFITREHDWDHGVSNFRLVSLDDSHRDAQFVFPPADPGERFRMLRITSGTDYVLKDFSIQQADDDTTSADIWLANDDGALIEDVEWLGCIPTDSHVCDQLLLFDCTSVEGVNVIWRVYIREGAALPGYSNGVAGIRITKRSVGEVRMIDCHIEQRGSSSFRATHTRDILRIGGDLSKNNDNTNMHISADGHPEKTSWIKGAIVIVDADNLDEHARKGDQLDNPEGLRIDSTGHGYTGILIEDCDFVYRSSLSSLGIITIPTYGSRGGFTMCNCRIINDTGVQTIYAEPVDTDIAREPWGVNLENVTISRAYESQPCGPTIVVDENRNGSRIADSCIYLPNGRVGGVLVNRASGCATEHPSINVSGPPTRTRGAELALDDVTCTAACAFCDG